MKKEFPWETFMKRRSLRNSFLLVLVLLPELAYGAQLWPASVNYSGRRIAGRPAGDHRPLAQGIHVAESEDCSVKSVSAGSLEVSDRCGYVRGLYRYIFIPEGGGPRRQILMGFSLHRASAQSHAFLAERPIEVEEGP